MLLTYILHRHTECYKLVSSVLQRRFFGGSQSSVNFAVILKVVWVVLMTTSEC